MKQLLQNGGDDDPISAIADGASDTDDSMDEFTVLDSDGERITLGEDGDGVSKN